MKVYVLDAIINSEEIKHKSFKTRAKASKYLEKILDSNNLVVDDIIYRNHNHNVEYVCDDFNRISINREIRSI